MVNTILSCPGLSGHFALPGQDVTGKPPVETDLG
jgi:hypothetical protein